MTIKMSEMKTGYCGTVTELINTGEMRRRLLDLGFSPGSTITCVGSSPLGDPVAFCIKGTVVAIRKSDSSKIIVVIEEGTDNDR